MRHAALVLVLSAVGTVALADDGDCRLVVVPAKTQPAVSSVMVYPAGATPDGPAKPALKSKTIGTPIVMPAKGVYDVYVAPSGGRYVKAAAGLKAEPGTTHTVKLVEKLGVIDVFRRDDSPRVGRVVVTDPFDAGPDEKGHVAVQTAPDFRVEMLVPEGDYAVWVVPENGARAIRVADRIRVLSGRVVRVD